MKYGGRQPVNITYHQEMIKLINTRLEYRRAGYRIIRINQKEFADRRGKKNLIK